MPNIGSLLKSEISRLSRREVRKEVQTLRKSSASYRHEIATLKRQVLELQRKASLLSKRAEQATPAPAGSAEAEKPMRFVAKGLRSLRNRLGLSASDLARLLGVSDQSVYNWEWKKSTPRKEQLARLAAMREMGKREAQRRLEELRETKPAGSGNGAAKTAPKRKAATKRKGARKRTKRG